jgi:hypothetical protein
MSSKQEGTTGSHKWEFKARFRRHAFAWRSQPAVTRIKEAIAEIRKAAKKEPVLAAEGAVVFLERVSPAVEHVDSSSGAIGAAVNHAIAELASLVADAPADEKKSRDAWLERLWDAYQAGYDDVLTILERAPYKMRHYRQYGVKALSAQGKKAEAIRYAEDRGLNDSPIAIARACEELLLSSGLVDEAYQRYGLTANQGSTYLATFRERLGNAVETKERIRALVAAEGTRDRFVTKVLDGELGL